jgi:leader peptidase (prepilin peptidase)/N-methyltransferase
MNEIEPDPFPDVGMTAKPALIILVVLAVSYVALFALLGVRVYDPIWGLLASAVLASGLLTLTYIDLRSGLLLDVLTLPLIALGIGYAAWHGGLLFSVAGAVVGYAMIAGLAAYWRASRGYEGIGLGDAKLLAACGAWVGVSGLPMVLLIGSGLGIVAALTVSKTTHSHAERLAIPFGPCLAIAGWAVWCGVQTVFLT